MTPPDDPRAAIVRLVMRLRAAALAERGAVVRELLPLLADARVPLPVRFAAAGRALDALPDTPDAIRGVVRALTARASPGRALARLRRLQHLTKKSDALDALVVQRERKVRLRCPRCAARLPRPEMVKHLWHEHGLTFVKGKARSRTQAANALRREHAATGDPALIDRAAALGGEAAVRAWAAETATAEEAAPLCAAARERGAGLCPTCFADVPPAAEALPPPLAVAHGRLAGDGFVSRAPALFRPRVRATVAAAGALLFFAPVVPVWLALALSAVAYALARALLAPKHTADDEAIDAAWRELAPKLADRRAAARFLARLCLTSVGRGDPLERAQPLTSVIARARANPAERHLLAAAQALQLDDGGRFGRDRAAGFAELVAPALRGEQPADFAAAVLAVYLSVPRAPGERTRLRVLLLAAAFRAGLAPRDVLDLCAAAPAVAAVVGVPPHHLALLYGVWANQKARDWQHVGAAKTVFELAATTPKRAERLLAHEPGLLLVCATKAAELGPVLVCVGGVSVGGVRVADPAADVRLEAGGRALVFGAHALRARGRLAEALPAELKAWLRFRAEVFAGYPAAFLRGDPPAARLLAPFVARCPACGTACLPAVGAVCPRLRVGSDP